MAAPMARLTMCDANDEEIMAVFVFVFVCVAGIARPEETKRQGRPTMPYVL